jgi:excisionase family DNA binding protein
MFPYDPHKMLSDIKADQEKIFSLLYDHLKGSSQQRIFSLSELTGILKVSKRTIATWLQQGILPHSKVGAKIWVTEEHLNSFLEQNSADSNLKNKISKT